MKSTKLVAFKAALKVAKVETDKEPGAVDIRLFVDKTDPLNFFAYEIFQGESAMQRQGEQPYVATLLAYLGHTETVAVPMFLGETNPKPVPAKAAKPDDDVFVRFFNFKFKHEYRDKLLAHFETHISLSRNEAGNLLFDLYTIDDLDDEFMAYKHWRKKFDVWEVHFKQPNAVETGTLRAEAVIGELEQYTSIVTEVN